MRYQRLKKQSDFDKLFKKGTRLFSPSLTVVYAPAKQLTMGVSVGKKHGKSVQRNRIKRLIREAFRQELPTIKGTYAFVIVPKVAEEYSLAVFQKHLQCIIEKAQL